MTKQAKYGIAGIAIFLLGWSIWNSVTADPAAQVQQAQHAAAIAQQKDAVRTEDIKTANESVPRMIADGLVYKVEPANYRAYVDELKWAGRTVDEKENVAALLGYYIEGKNGDTLGIDIYGSHSGQKLGEWSIQVGFRAGI